MIEAGVLLDISGKPLYWHLPNNRSSVALPDSRNLWDVIWENRENVSGFAHSHPGSGKTGPSWTDLTTFAAIEAGLGKRLDWWITSEDEMIILRWKGPDKHNYKQLDIAMEPSWVLELRKKSNYGK